MLIRQGRIFMYIENIVRLITGSMATLQARAFAPPPYYCLISEGPGTSGVGCGEGVQAKVRHSRHWHRDKGHSNGTHCIAGRVAAAIGRGPIASMQRRRVASRLGCSG